VALLLADMGIILGSHLPDSTDGPRTSPINIVKLDNLPQRPATSEGGQKQFHPFARQVF
jgi:hypothetical protein